MKIAVYHNLPSGGGKRALYELTRRLAAKHNVDVYTLSVAEHDFCDLRPHCNRHVVFPFKPLTLARRPFGRLNQGIRSLDLQRLCALQKGIARHIDDQQRYDLVFAHVCQFGQSPSLLQFLETPSVYYCQEPPRLLYEPREDRPYDHLSTIRRVGNLVDPLPGLYRRTMANLDRKNVQAATSVLVNSHYSRETLYRVYGILPVFSRLGVDTTRFRPLGVDKERMVLSVGALTPKKGFEFLVRSLAYIEASHRPALVIVSNFADMREKAYLENLANRLSVTVTFRVGIPDEDLVQFYNRAMLTVYTPIMEPFGFVPLESMACGTPVVGIREAGVRETVRHPETGFLVDRDPEQFAVVVLALLNNRLQRDAMGREALAYVENVWSWERSIEELDLHLQQTVQR